MSTSKNQLLLDLSITENDFEFATSVTSALNQAELELQSIDETIDSIKVLRPECDKLDYILAASAGALCGLIDIFLVGKSCCIIIKIYIHSTRQNRRVYFYTPNS